MTETKGMIPEMCNETISLIDNTDDISSLLQIWDELNDGLKELTAVHDKVKVKIKNFLTEKGWKNYKDENTKISISITEIQKEQIDKTQLKLLLSDSQYAQISSLKSYERLNIINSKRRAELNKFIRK